VTGEVGRVIAQCLAGVAISTDKKVTMWFPEQSLTHPFRVYTLTPVAQTSQASPAGYLPIGNTYLIREPGDRFIKPVTLEFSLESNKIKRIPLKSLAVFSYDSARQQWAKLKSRIDSRNRTVSTDILSLPENKAMFALFRSANSSSLSTIESSPQKQKPQLKAYRGSGPILTKDTFEKNSGQWTGRDREAGAKLERRTHRSGSGNYLRLVNHYNGGNFASTIHSKPYNVRDFPIISFDYRIRPGTKLDVLAKVNGRWYNVGFTDDEIDYRNRDVNITRIGSMPGIIADGKWHRTSFDLDAMLRTKTQHHIVEELVFADWNVGGFMKLEFGRNRAGAYVDIDNFTIKKGKEADKETNEGEVFVLQDFEPSGNQKSLNCSYSAFCSKKSNSSTLSIDTTTKDAALRVDYDVTNKDSFGGVSIVLPNIQAISWDRIKFRVSGQLPENTTISLNSGTSSEYRVPIKRYLPSIASEGWQAVVIPLKAFNEFMKSDRLTALNIGFSHSSTHKQGYFQVDDIQLLKGSPKTLLVSDFEHGAEQNQLGGKSWLFKDGVAEISSKIVDTKDRKSSNVLRISYGGDIGKSFGGRVFSYCGWTNDLKGMDGSSYKQLSFDIRGDKGGERPNIYLDDGTVRRPVDIENYVTVSHNWKTVSIPLNDFASQDIDLTHLREMQIVYEWEKAEGSIYLDNIRFK